MSEGKKTYTLEAQIWMPRPMMEVVGYVTNARNHTELAPPWLNLRVLTRLPVIMQRDTLIDYAMRLRGIPIQWQSKVTAWEPPRRVVYEQVHGPFKVWEHEMTFVELNGGTVLRDKVEYRPPLGFITHAIFLQRDLDAIFEYRHIILKDRFGTHPSG